LFIRIFFLSNKKPAYGLWNEEKLEELGFVKDEIEL
jgi:hypothetical protein